jgi:hypothetical protein
MAYKIGIFFIMIGIIGLLIFITSVQAQQALCIWGAASVIAIVFGLVLAIRNRVAAPPSEYFRIVRQVKDKKKK